MAAHTHESEMPPPDGKIDILSKDAAEASATPTPESGMPSAPLSLVLYTILIAPDFTTVPTFNGMAPQDVKRAALQELRNRALLLHTNIKAREQEHAALASQRSMMAEGVFLQQIAIAQQDILRRRAVLTRWNMILSANGVPPIG